MSQQQPPFSDPITDSRHWFRYLEEHASSTPPEQRVLQRRSVMSGIYIVRDLAQISDTDYADAMDAIRTWAGAGELYSLYASMLDQAKRDPETFIRGLHQRYIRAIRMMKEQHQLVPFFRYLSRLGLMSGQFAFMHRDDKENSDAHCAFVYNRYMELLIQQTDYLKMPFDPERRVAGMTTEGKLIRVPEYAPYLDELMYVIMQPAEPGAASGSMLADVLKKNGLTANFDFTTVDRISEISSFFTRNLAAMLPYINEFTVDILPDRKHAFDTDIMPLLGYAVVTEAEYLRSLLRHRRRMLPVNGAEFVAVKNAGKQYPLRAVYLKELYCDGQFLLLYRVTYRKTGMISGFCDVSDPACPFFSPLQFTTAGNQTAALAMFAENLEKLVLYCYAAVVCDDSSVSWEAMPGDVLYLKEDDTVENISMEYCPHDGLPRDVIKKKHCDRIPVQGKIVMAENACDADRELATALGFELKDNERYVMQ